MVCVSDCFGVGTKVATRIDGVAGTTEKPLDAHRRTDFRTGNVPGGGEG